MFKLLNLTPNSTEQKIEQNRTDVQSPQIVIFRNLNSKFSKY